MRTRTAANILGALTQALSDAVAAGVRAESGHAPTTAAALVHLSKYAGEPVEGLRSPLGLSHPGCVRVVDRLEEEGLVTRAPGRDARSRMLTLTRTGEAAATGILAARQRALSRALRALSADDRETLALLASEILVRLVGSEDEALAVCRLCDYESCPDEVCPSARALAGGP